MAYRIQYRMNFSDRLKMLWRVDFLLKDGPIITPTIIDNPGAEPLVIEWGKNESLIDAIIESKAYITYYVTGTAPLPPTFINIEEDTWLIEVYRGTPALLWWKGFIKPDNNSYPWLYPPYEFKINAVDFTFCKGTVVDLNLNGILLYDFINLGDFINRSLFQSVGYDDVILKILYSLKPNIIAADPLTTGIYFHTDAFYSLNDGANFSFDALTKVLASLGARMFYANGSYWLQRIAEIGGVTQTITTINRSDIIGVSGPNTDTVKILSSMPSADIFYLDRSALIRIDPAIKQQDADYELKAINQIKNFDWRTNTQSPFDDWEGDTTGFFVRFGDGSVDDPYKLFIVPPPPATTRQIWTRIPATIGQIIEIDLKAIGLNASYIQIFVYLVNTGTITTLRRLDDGGNWVPAAGNSTDELRLSVENKTGEGTMNIISKRIPQITGSPNIEVMFLIGHVIPVSAPTGDVSVSLFPVFGRLYLDNYSNITNKILSNKTFSFIPEKRDLFFLDTLDANLSNTVFYDSGSGIIPIPDNNWDGLALEENTARLILDQNYTPGDGFTGTVLSNKLQFNNAVVLADNANETTVILRDRYSVRACTHELTLSEFSFPGTGTGTYSETPITRQ